MKEKRISRADYLRGINFKDNPELVRSFCNKALLDAVSYKKPKLSFAEIGAGDWKIFIDAFRRLIWAQIEDKKYPYLDERLEELKNSDPFLFFLTEIAFCKDDKKFDVETLVQVMQKLSPEDVQKVISIFLRRFSKKDLIIIGSYFKKSSEPIIFPDKDLNDEIIDLLESQMRNVYPEKMIFIRTTQFELSLRMKNIEIKHFLLLRSDAENSDYVCDRVLRLTEEKIIRGGSFQELVSFFRPLLMNKDFPLLLRVQILSLIANKMDYDSSYITVLRQIGKMITAEIEMIGQWGQGEISLLYNAIIAIYEKVDVFSCGRCSPILIVEIDRLLGEYYQKVCGFELDLRTFFCYKGIGFAAYFDRRTILPLEWDVTLIDMFLKHAAKETGSSVEYSLIFTLRLSAYLDSYKREYWAPQAKIKRVFDSAMGLLVKGVKEEHIIPKYEMLLSSLEDLSFEKSSDGEQMFGCLLNQLSKYFSQGQNLDLEKRMGRLCRAHNRPLPEAISAKCQKYFDEEDDLLRLLN